MSILMKEQQFDKVRQYTQIAFKLLFLFSFPIICFVEIFAPDIVHLFAGPGFDGAILPMRIIMIQLIIIGSAKIIVQQLLVPLRKDRAIVLAGLAGVVTWCVMTIILVPKFQSVGTTIVWLLAELTVLLFALVEVRRSLAIRFPLTLFFISCLTAIPYLIIGYLVMQCSPHSLTRLLICMLLFVIYATLLEALYFKTGILSSCLRFFHLQSHPKEHHE
jgi:O-antigen/teichoic acid export membrane protein